MKFKETLEADISSVFFDVDEMADEHVLQGETIPMVLINDKSDNNMTGFSREQLYAAQEVYKQYKTIYVKSVDFYVPNIDTILNLDGIEYDVEEASEDCGVICIVLSLNES